MRGPQDSPGTWVAPNPVPGGRGPPRALWATESASPQHPRGCINVRQKHQFKCHTVSATEVECQHQKVQSQYPRDPD